MKPAGKLRIVKLHGSIYWLKRKDTGQVFEKEYDIDHAQDLGTSSVYNEEIVIYPVSQKELYVYPYIQMFYWLNHELKNKKVWIIIGYSFRDPIIHNLFDIHLKGGNIEKMVLVHPDAENVVNDRFHEYKNDARIIRLETRFGQNNNYTAVNEQIANCLE